MKHAMTHERKYKPTPYIDGLGAGFTLATLLVGVTTAYFSLILYEPRVEYTVTWQIADKGFVNGFETLEEIEKSIK